jgi:integration host factor subunit alpha
MTLTKADFTESLFDELGIGKGEAKAMVELFFEEIKRSLEQGKPVKISAFGKFELRDKTSRPGRNPKTGEVIPITARRVVTFRASQKLKAHSGNTASNSCQ